MDPPPPGLFTTTQGHPFRSPKSAVNSLAIASAVPPGGKLTRNSIGRDGLQSLPRASVGNVIAAPSSARRVNISAILIPLLGSVEIVLERSDVAELVEI